VSLKRQRALERLRAARRRVEDEGFSSPPDLLQAAALTAGVVAILRNADNAARASAAARYVFRVAERSFERTGLAREIACRAGCSYCCNGYVSATAPQVFAAAHAIRAEPARAGEIAARVAAANRVTRGLDWDARCRARNPCPMLEQNLCGIYASRPLACRGFAYFSLPACVRSFEQQTDDVPIPPAYAQLRSALESALRAGLKATGFGWRSYELNHALAVALETPDAEAAWLAGEPVLAAVALDPLGSADEERMREAMLDELIALAEGKPMPAPAARSSGHIRPV